MKKKILSLLLAGTIAISTVLPTASFAAEKELNVTRISGSGRYETSVKASIDTFKSSRYAIVASGEGFADALVGGTLASQIKAPILLVGKNSVSPSVTNEIKRLGVEKVYLLGGTGTITSNVENTLKNTGVKVERLAGKNRTYTAQAIAKVRAEFLNVEVSTTSFAAIDSNHYADALSAAPFVAQLEEFIPLLPVVKGNVNSAHSMAFGGINSVTKSTSEKVRYAGSNREATAVKVAEAYKNIDTVVLVDGYNYPDALASAPIATVNNGAVLLTNSKTLSKATKDFIYSNESIKNVIIVGGTNSVSIHIEKELRGEAVSTEPLYDVVRVKDGDTIVVNFNGKQETVRFLLVDTPESVHSDSSKNTPYGKIASDYTKNLLTGKKVSLKFDVGERDRYGRLLAYVYLGDGRMVNEMLLSEGHAKISVYQPNVLHVDKFRALEKEAQVAKKGIWADGVSAFEPSNNNSNSNNANNTNNGAYTGVYVASINSNIFHKITCGSAKQIKEHNKVIYQTKAAAIKVHTDPCDKCNP